MSDSSIWKREFSLRKKKTASPESPVDAASVLDEPVGIELPELETPELETPELETPELETPELETRQLETPQLETTALETTVMESEPHSEPDPVGGWPIDQRSEDAGEPATADEPSPWPSYAEVLGSYPEPSHEEPAEHQSDTAAKPDDRMAATEWPHDPAGQPEIAEYYVADQHRADQHGADQHGAVEAAVVAESPASESLEQAPEWPESAPVDGAAGSEPPLVESLIAAAILSADEAQVAPQIAPPADADAEAAQPEPAQPEPAQSEPARPEPAQPEAVQPEPAQAEPVEPEAAQPEPVQPEPVQPEDEPEAPLAPAANAKPGKRKAPPASSSVKKLVGLRIGSSQLAAACVHNNGSAELTQIARSPLERGIVAGGEVRDPEALTRALKAFFAANKLPRRGVRLGIASNRIGVRILEVPALDDPKLFDNSVRFHAQETLPIAVTDAITEHVVLGPGAGSGTGAELEPTVRVLLVFAHRELVERHVEACRRAGLKIEGVDFEAFALLRALSVPRPEDVEPERAVVAVAVGNERTIFAVSDGRICDFTRVLEWGGGSLDVAMGRVLGLTPSQAEPIKHALSIGGDLAPPDLPDDQVAAARDAIRIELQSLARELVSSLQFYQARPGSLDIGEILLSGGGAQLIGFAEELERLVGVPVRIGDPFGRIHMSKKVTMPAEPGSLAVAIGLGIEDR